MANKLFCVFALVKKRMKVNKDLYICFTENESEWEREREIERQRERDRETERQRGEREKVK